MRWIDIAWPMIGSACLTLGLLYLFVWIRQPNRQGYLLFFLTATSVAVYSIFELRFMRASTPDAVLAALRRGHLPIFLMFIGMVGFVRIYFRTARMWLGYLAIAVRGLSLVLNFTTGSGLNFSHVDAMQALPVWGGETVYLPVGVPSPLRFVAQFANLLLVAFLADAAVRLWRTGDADECRRALRVGGSLVLSVAAGGILAAAVNGGLLRIPSLFSVAFLLVVLAMAYELGRDVVMAAELHTRLEHSEDKLRESEQRLQLAAAAGQLALWEWGVDTNRIWMTREGRILLGLPPDEPLDAERFMAQVHPEDREGITTAAQIAARDGAEFEHDYRIVLPSGDTRYVSSRGRLAQGQAGGGRIMRGVTQDITARKQAEDRFRTLVDATPTALLLVDGDGRIALVNGRAESLFGYRRDELLGHSIEQLVPEQLRDAHRREREHYQETPTVRGVMAGRELVARRKDGRVLPVEVGVTPMQTFEGPMILASIVDLSERKQAELEAARRRDEIAHLARVAMLGELSGALAHEINQPLAAILGNAQAAQRFIAQAPPQLDQVKEILADIASGVKRAGEVIRRLRSLLRKEDSHIQPVDLNDIVEEVLGLMRSDLVNRQVEVHTELASDLPPILGDRVQLQQVLLNLLINGCDAMAGASTEQRLVIRTARTGTSACLIVADRGTGIPEGELERIFEPFVTTKPQGLGLGLAVCRSIAAAHGGTLVASNNADGGATFTLDIPCAASTVP